MMGITIYAQGKLDRIGDIPCLIDDLKGVAGEHNWTHHVIDDDFDVQPNAVFARRDSGTPVAEIEGSLGLKGIVLNVGSGVEPLSILFDRSGVLTEMLQQLSWLQASERNERFSLCKTQFGSIDAHIEIIAILDLVKKKYVSDLAVTDEGAYWESRDRRILAEKRVALGHYLRHTEKVIGSIERSDDDARDPDAVARRIEEALLKADEEGRLGR
jgi:hypothetical protein